MSPKRMADLGTALQASLDRRNRERVAATNDCPFCTHSLHDGDGASEPYSCCEDDCACRWEWCDLKDDGIYTAIYVGREWPKERRHQEDGPTVRTPITPITKSSDAP